MLDLGTDRIFRVRATVVLALARIGLHVRRVTASYVNLTLTSAKVLAYAVIVRMRTEMVKASECGLKSRMPATGRPARPMVSASDARG